MAASTALLAVSMAATAISTGIGIYSSIKQSQAQQAQQEYQSAVARRNAELAEQQASALRKQAFEDKQSRRFKTAQLLASQRAQAGASGVAVDTGSFEDVAEDTAARGEMDAINAFNRGMDQGYNAEVQAWNYQTTAEAHDMAADYAGQAGALNAIGQGIGGIAQMGSVWNSFRDPIPDQPAGGWGAGGKNGGSVYYKNDYGRMNLGGYGR